MLLGNTSWRIRRVQMGRVLVEDAQGAPPNIPFWLGEAPARTAELSEQLSELRAKIGQDGARASPEQDAPAGRGAAIAWLEEECGLDRAGAEQAVDYVLAGRAVLGAVLSSDWPGMLSSISSQLFCVMPRAFNAAAVSRWRRSSAI